MVRCRPLCSLVCDLQNTCGSRSDTLRGFWSALRLLDDADLQRIGISSLGPRRKILGLLAQQGQTGSSADGPIRLSARHATDSPVRLTPPMLESQLAKRHCVKVSSAAGVADAHAVAASIAGDDLPDAEPVCEEQSSLWELASRHDAKPFEYRTILLPVEDARAESGHAGQVPQPSGESIRVSVDICNDDTRLAALDDLLQESSPPPRSAVAGCSSTADTQSKVAGPGNAVSLGSDEVYEYATATTQPTGSDAVEERVHVEAADTRCICADAPNSNFGASKLSSARSGSQAMWDMADAKLATVLELPSQLWSGLNEASPQVSVAQMCDSRCHTLLNALRETFLERLRLLRLDYGRQVEDVLKIIGAEGLQDTTTHAMCIDVMDRSDAPAGTTASPNTTAQVHAAVPTTVDSDFQSLPDDAIVLDEDSSARLKNTGLVARCNDSSRHDGTMPDGELDHDSISLSGNSQQSTVDGLLTNDWGHQEAADGSTAEQMPNFGAMDTAELKKRVKQFGLKVSGKKVMVRQLSEIWIAQNRPRNDSTAAATTAPGDTATVQLGAEAPEELENTATGTSCMGPDTSPDRHAQSKLSREQILSRQVRAFVLSQPHWYTTVLLLNAIDMRALHAALSNAASLDSSMIKCSLKQLETILREQGIAFQAQS